ncbi:MAG: hypothetical protein ACK5P5_12705 [Pseudobdellovibrionaceae bacterium]
MKTSKTLIMTIMISIFTANTATAATQKTKSAKKTSSQQRLKQDVSFDEHTVSGNYQLPFESTTVVEDEKNLDDLIGVRKNFQDRIQAAQELR